MTQPLDAADTPPPHAKGLLDALERSFLQALRTPRARPQPAALLWTDADRQWAASWRALQNGAAAPLRARHLRRRRSARARRSGCAASSTARCADVTLARASSRSSTFPASPAVAARRRRLPARSPAARRAAVSRRVWHQRNGRDWTVEAFLVSDDGLRLDIAQDARTREAALRACRCLPRAARRPARPSPRGRRFRSARRRAIRSATCLRWMSVGEAFARPMAMRRWRAFRGVCSSEFRFDPDKTARRRRGERARRGRWKVG